MLQNHWIRENEEFNNPFVLLLLQNGASLKAKYQDKRTPIEECLMRKQMTAFKTMVAYTQFWNQKIE